MISFKQCINYAKKHNQQFIIREVDMLFTTHILNIADAIDGYLRTENYWYQKAYPSGFCYGCYHDSYELKKDETLARYVCEALCDDYDSVKFGVWYGCV